MYFLNTSPDAANSFKSLRCIALVEADIDQQL